MKISPTDPTYIKQKKLERVAPASRAGVIERLSIGETVDITTTEDIHNDPLIPALTELMKTRTLDLTKHEALYYSVNRRLLPLRQQLARKIYDPYRKHAQTIRKLNEADNGFTDEHKFRHIGAFPPDFYQAVTEQYPDSKERDLVIKWLLKTPEGEMFSTVKGGI